MPSTLSTPPSDLTLKVVGAFPSSKYRWRTVRGIARDLGLSEAEVEVVIRSHPKLFRVSSTAPAGIPLYSPRGDPHLVSTDRQPG